MLSKMTSLVAAFATAILAVLVFLASCAKPAEGESIAVFIPGFREGSATYDLLARGVEEAVAAREKSGEKIGLAVIEGGFNQAEWEKNVTTLAASGRYTVIVSSNPSLPDIVAEVSKRFPKQKFILFDGELDGNPSVYTLRYKQREQAFLAGHIAALTIMETAGAQKKIGLVAGQEYPMLNNVIFPAYLEGAKAADEGFSAELRIVGNWYDAQKARELSESLINSGASVLLAVAGSANEGVLQAASESAAAANAASNAGARGAKVVWFDTNGYALAPGIVVGSAIIRQDAAAAEKMALYFEGKLPFGRAEAAGVREGYVDFLENDPDYINTVGEAVRSKQSELLKNIRDGELALE
jgi:simple sugar transport system substrate-binding protein